MKALILVNGELYKPDVPRSRIRAEAFDLVLGADGSARYAYTYNVTLDAIIDDLDSLSDLEQQGSSAPVPLRTTSGAMGRAWHLLI